MWSLTNQQCSSIHDFDNMVTVLVGKEEKRFNLHQDAVCAKSKFFRAACSKEWLEGQERMVRLPETEDTTFHEYCTWIYSGEIADGTCTLASTFEFQRLAKLHILGDKLDDIQLRNKANIKLFKSMQKMNAVPHAQCLKVIWESTMPGSLLRALIVDLIVNRLSRDTFAAVVSQYPTDCLQEIAVAALRAGSVLTWEQMALKLSKYGEVEKTS